MSNTRNRTIERLFTALLTLTTVLSMPLSKQVAGQTVLEAGTLDATFGSGGLVVTPLPGEPDRASGQAVAVQNDGKIVVAGTAGNAALSENDIVIARYLPDGSLDSTFGEGGLQLIDAPGPEGLTRDMIIDQSGKILLGGGAFSFRLTRLDGNGQLDATFGNNGVVTLGDIPGSALARGVDSLAIQADGKIVASGTYFGVNPLTLGDLALMRLNQDGSIDSSFGENGFVHFDVGAEENRKKGLAIDDEGGIVVAGNSAFSNGVSDTFVMRYNANGSVDASFSDDGLQIIPGEGSNKEYEVEIDDQGKILVAGKRLLRLNADGSLDNSFENDGIAGHPEADFTCLKIQNDGKIVAGGRLGNAYVARFNSDGTQDLTFNETGFNTVSFTSTQDYFNDLALQTDGKVVAVGVNNDPNTSGSPQNIFGIARVLGDNLPPEAVAGSDQSIRVGDTVFLDGSESFDDNTDSLQLNYAWSIVQSPAGSSATLDDETAIAPSFVADIAGTFVVQLIVTDEFNAESQPATVSISSDNLAPVAVPTSEYSLAIVGQPLQLNGSQSFDPEDDAITFEWMLLSAPAGSAATIDGPTSVLPSITTDIEGDYELLLVVSDFIGPGIPVTLELTATSASGFAEAQILAASDLVCGLENGQVLRKGHQRILNWFLTLAIRKLQKGNTNQAVRFINRALKRVDGCAERGSLDLHGPGRDWIIDCDAQVEILRLIATG